MKKKAVKKSAAKSGRKSSAKAKAKAKAKPRAKAAAKTKAKPAAKAKAKAKVKPVTKARSKPSQGLTVIDLFKMKKEREQQAAQDAEAWKHKKDLPPQDTHQPEEPKFDNVKKSGFGGTRHH